MADYALEKNQWEEFCNRLSRHLQGARAEIEVESLKLGDQVEAEWVPLLGVAYDPKDDLIEVAVEDLDHLIHAPRRLLVQQEGALVKGLAVETGAGETHLIQFREPLGLPAPGA